ncbi:LysR family transcriptional regulator [uncultured Xanthomonas sp.]|uniref:LysR family transcriptional regulator n=1 Tax=uncultured Xanthomonas sp. TaxID=152831 RepID=UPI003748FB54
MDSLGSLRGFVQVMESGGFAEAGRALGLSASAMAKSVARLEQSLGVRLFHRSTRSLTLTAEGQLLLPRCRRILAEVEAARGELGSLAATPKGRLRISLPMNNNVLLPVLGDFMRAYPQVQLDLDFDDRLVDVIEEGFDAVLRVAEPDDSRLASRRLGSFRRCLVASPDYLQRCGTPLRPADLLTHQCLHYRFRSSGRLEAWPLGAAAADLSLPVSMVCNNIETRLSFAVRGCGIAFLPEHSVRAELAAGTLRTLLDDYVDSTGTFHLLWPSSRHMLPKLRVLVDFLGERLMF